MIRSVLKTGADVEDTMQDTYLAALRNLERFEGRAQFGTWLLKIGTNAALARRRQRMRAVQLDEVPDLDDLEPVPDVAEDATRTPEQQVSKSEIAAIVEAAIGRLPYDYRQVVMLRTIEGLDTAETAEPLGIGEDAVRQRLHRAREMLKADLRALGWKRHPHSVRVPLVPLQPRRGQRSAAPFRRARKAIRTELVFCNFFASNCAPRSWPLTTMVFVATINDPSARQPLTSAPSNLCHALRIVTSAPVNDDPCHRVGRSDS